MALAWILLLVFYLPAYGLEVLKHQAGKPEIDGSPDDLCWQSLAWHTDFTVCGQAKKPREQTRFKIFHDGACLWFLIECDEDSVEKLVAERSSPEKNPYLWLDDSVELTIIADRSFNKYWKYVFNSAGGAFAYFFQDDNTGRNTYTCKGLHAEAEFSARTCKSKWMVEGGIPLSAIGIDGNTGLEWAINVGRNCYAGEAAEYSTFSPVSSKGHGPVREYRKWELEKLPLQDFFYTVKLDCSHIIKEESGYAFDLTATVINESSKFSTGDFLITVKNKNTITIFEKKMEMECSTTIPSTATIQCRVPEQGNYLVSCVYSAFTGRRYAEIHQQKSIQYIPISMEIQHPAYKKAFFSKMRDKNLKVRITSGKDINITEATILLTERNFRHSEKLNLINHESFFQYDFENLPDGNYCLTVQLDSGREKFEVSSSVRKLPPAKYEYWVENRTALYLNSKIFTPFGYFDPPSRPTTQGNVMQTYARWKTPKRWLEDLERTHAAGLRMLVNPYCENSKEYEYEIFKDHKYLNEIQKQKITEQILAVREHPGTFGYYMDDEPEGRENNPSWYCEVFKLVDELDPYHPAIMLNYSIEGMEAYGQAADMLFPDPYPNFYTDGTTQKPMSVVAQLTDFAGSMKPHLACLQGFVWNSDGNKIARAPSLKELRNNFCQAIAYDSCGILYFLWENLSVSADLRYGTEQIGKEVALLNEYIAVPSDHSAIIRKPGWENYGFITALKRLKNHYILIAVNNRNESVTHQLQFDKREDLRDQLHIFGEDRSVSLKENGFTDTFSPYEARIYVTDAALAKKVRIADAQEAVDSFLKKSHKPGNKLFIGEVNADKYKRIMAGQITGLPRISTSSSVFLSHSYSKYAGYFLADGWIDIGDNPIPGWTPAANDITPWISVKFPDKTDFSKMVFYTQIHQGEALLKGASVSVLKNGKWEEIKSFADNTEKRIELSFPPVTTSEVKVLITDFIILPVKDQERLHQRYDAAGVLLTEMEIF